jgi:hypothetical protein
MSPHKVPDRVDPGDAQAVSTERIATAHLLSARAPTLDGRSGDRDRSPDVRPDAGPENRR